MNEKMSFDNFFIDYTNKNAYKTIKKISEDKYNSSPVVIIGNHGVGKTHLVTALVEESKQKSVSRISFLDWNEELINSIKNNQAIIFFDYYLTKDILIIENCEFISGKYMIQEKLYNLIKLYETENKIIIFTSSNCLDQIDLIDKLYYKLKNSITLNIKNNSRFIKSKFLKKAQKELGLQFNLVEKNYIIKSSKSIREMNGKICTYIAHNEMEMLGNTRNIFEKKYKREMTYYEISYIKKWKLVYKYSDKEIEFLLSLSNKESPNFEYFDRIISDWHARNYRNITEIKNFISKMKMQTNRYD